MVRIVRMVMLRGVGLAFAGVLLIGVAWLAIQISDRSPAVTDAAIVILPPVVEQGETMQVDVRVFYRRACQTYIVRRLYDAKGEKYAVPELVLPPGTPGLQHSVSTIVVAPNFAVGEGRYVSSPSYGCNWFQRLFWPIPAPDRFAAFQVVQRRQ